MSANLSSSEKHKTQTHPNSLANLRPIPWKPGQSGNPGGVRKGTVFVSECYKRLMSLPIEELREYQPKNGAEAAALKQALNTIDSDDALLALPSLKEITDRTEGKAPQRVEVAQVDDRAEEAIQLAMTRLNLDRDGVIAWLSADSETAEIVRALER